MITRTNGLLAGLVSVILGVGAHGMAGGALPESRQLMILVVIGVGVGSFRAAQARDSKLAIAAVLIAGQVAAHGTLSLMGSASGHHHAVNSAAMLGWHVAALPVAVLALCAAAWLLRLVTSAAGVVVERSSGPIEVTTAPQVRREVFALHHLTPHLSVGMRAPPVAG